MNLHAPQSVEAATELREIAAVPLQIVSPRESVPIVSVVQDTLVGANRFARSETLFTKKEAMNLLVHAKSWDGTLPPPATVDPQPLWSGQQLLSCLLPPVTLSMKNNSDQVVEIYQGKINPTVLENGEEKPNGRLDKKVFSKQLLHIIYNDYGPDVTVNFLDSLQAMIANFLMNNGFSVGISDLIADDETMGEIREAMKKLTNSIETQILQIHTGLFENTSGRSNQEEFEGKVMGTLNKAVGDAGKIGLKSLADTNRMTNMVKAGSKGSDVNVSQMIAVLGQQAIEGKRVPNGFQHRTLPHFKRFDDSARARGFIASSYITGLQPDEFFFHAMSGREGLIDTAVKTADTGYMQRRIRVALEDLITQHDGSVRDTTGGVLQLSYGEDGINATKLEEQRLPIDSWDDAKLAEHYAAEGAAGAAAYLDAAKNDRRILVEKVCGGRPNPMVRAPVHMERMIFRIRDQFGLARDAGTVTAEQVLEAQTAILRRTHINNHVWAALVRHYMAPKLMRRHGFTKDAMDALVEQIVVKHWRAWVEPGQPVGVLAAQSIGEPATQMTLNSVDWHTEIMIARDGKFWAPKIGEFIDNYMANCEKSKIQHLPNDQLYVPLDDGHEWSAVSCDENGKMMWTKLEAITKHPVINEDGTNTILEVTTESGRTVRATKARSFLIHRDGKIVDINGSDLRVGDELPVANTLAIDSLGTVYELALKTILPPTEYLYGDEIAKALAALNAADEAGVRHWFSHANGKNFTVPYSRSDGFREAFVNGHNSRGATFKSDCVYPKSTRSCTSHIPSVIPLSREFGFFVGAYLAEGSSSATQIHITNNDNEYLEPIRGLLDAWSVGHHTVSEDRLCKKTEIRGHTQSLIVHSTIISSLFRKLFGEKSYVKTIPDWVLQAPDTFVHGLIDGYFSGDGCVQTDGTIYASSVSESLLVRMGVLLSRYGIFTTHSSYMPDLRKFKSVSRCYKLYIPQKYSQVFASTFTLILARKQERLNMIRERKDTARCYKVEFADMILDRVKTITEVQPFGDRVYDVTVEKTRNFTVLNQLVVRDTFHLAGVAAKSNMTRGVPRLKELLTATKNPKAVELTIPLRRDLRDKKEEARRVAQQLEFTLLQDLVTTARIYFDPYDESTMVTADQEWMAYQRAFEAQEPAEDQLSRSPWLLRIELDRERMFAKNITMDDIAFILNSAAENGGHSAGLHMLYTDYNATQLVFRMRLNSADPTAVKKGKAAKAYVDDLEQLKIIQNKILANTAIRGVAGLRSVNYQKNTDLFELEGDRYKRVEQYILVSDGSNFLEVLTHPDVDPTRIVSSSVHDMLENLGIEATRATLFKEITSLFAESGTNVNYRHVCILVDRMCHKGRLMSVDRYGINKNDIGPLAKMSFEQTEDIALRAAQFGERDPVQGVSAKVMLGAPIRAGTAFTDLLFDEQAAVKLAKSTPEQIVKPVRKLVITSDEMNVVTYGDDTDRGECGTIVDAMRSNISLPPNKLTTVAEEPDAEVDLLIVDE
jgi:DNA-directed RNA polymerase beta' subunit